MQRHPNRLTWSWRLAAAGSGGLQPRRSPSPTSLAAPALPANAQSLSFIRDTEIEQLLNDYAQPIFRAAGLGSGRITMRIIHHESFNAFVLDGSNVFIHTGSLQVSDTPNQVIGVIAHEAGHIANAHLTELRAKIANDPTRGVLSQFLFVGVLLGQRRGQELVADQAGLRYLTATHQSGRGMIEVFERFAQDEFDQPAANARKACSRAATPSPPTASCSCATRRRTRPTGTPAIRPRCSFATI